MSIHASSTYAPILFGILVILTISCDNDSLQSKESPTSSVPGSSSQQVPSPTPQPTTVVEHDDLTLVHVLNEPFTLVQVEVTKAKNLKNSRLTLEIQNVSGKTVKLVTYGLGVSVLCSEFMYAMIPTPNIGYGDWRIAGGKTNSRNEPPLKPEQRVTITVEQDEYLTKLLNPNTYRSCPKGHKKPELMLQNVYFDDGTEWRPNQQLSPPSRNQ